MKYVLLLAVSVSIVLASFGSLAATPVFAQPATQPVLRATNEGPHFFAGETVVLDQELTGDVYVAAQNVRVETTIHGDLLVAAAQVTISGLVTEDVRAAAATVTILGTVEGNVTAASATFTTDSQSHLEGSVVSASGTIDLYGQVLGNTWLRSSEVNMAGQFQQNVDIRAQKLTILPGTVVQGNLKALVSGTSTVSDRAQILGLRTIQMLPESQADSRQILEKMPAISGVGLVILLVMGLVGGAAILALFPKVAGRTSAVLLERPIASFGWGLSHLILTPVVVLLLMVTVVGIPIGVLLLLFYSLSLLVGGWIAAYALGQKLLRPARSSYTTQLAQFGLGLILLSVLDLVPILGWVVKVVALMLGMGALLISGKDAWWGREPVKAKKVVPIAVSATKPRKKKTRVGARATKRKTVTTKIKAKSKRRSKRLKKA